MTGDLVWRLWPISARDEISEEIDEDISFLVGWFVGQSKAKPWQWERRTVVRLSLESALGRGQGTHGWMVQQHNCVTQRCFAYSPIGLSVEEKNYVTRQHCKKRCFAPGHSYSKSLDLSVEDICDATNNPEFGKLVSSDVYEGADWQLTNHWSVWAFKSTHHCCFLSF